MILKIKIYYKKVKGKEKIILSEDFSMKFIKNIHENIYCHIGIKQMENKIRSFYTTNNLTQNIKKICKAVGFVKKIDLEVKKNLV